MGEYLKACAAGLLLATVACGSQEPGGSAGLTRPGSKEVLWVFESGGAIESNPEVVGDAVVVASVSGTLYSLDRKTGAVRWKYDARQDAKSSEFHADPLAADDLIVVGTDGQGEGHIYAFEAGSGQVRWKQPISGDPNAPGGLRTDIARAGGNVYAVGMDGKLRCLDLRTGKENWTFDGVEPESSPAADASRVFVAGTDGKVHALDAATGQPAWETDLESTITTGLMTRNDSVFVGTSPFRVVDLASQTGSANRKFALQAKPVRTLVLAQNFIVAFLHSNFAEGEADTLIALDLGAGRIAWARKAPTEWTSVHPEIWRDMVLAGDREGELQAFGLADGVKRWTYKAGAGLRGIGVADDALYLGTTQGTLFAVDPQKIAGSQGAK